MKQVFGIVALALLAVVVAVIGIGLWLPSRWHVERSLLVNASPSNIHPLVEDLRRWPEWADGPMSKSFTFSYSDPAIGPRATRSWQGAQRGHLTLLRSDPAAGVWFESGQEGDDKRGQGSITYQLSAAGTKIVWRDEGELPSVLGPYLRDGVEQELRAHFDASLHRLKRLAEAREQAAQ